VPERFITMRLRIFNSIIVTFLLCMICQGQRRDVSYGNPDTLPRYLGGLPIYTAPANENQTLSKDIEYEGHQPDQEISINNLDEAKIEQWWNNFKAEHQWGTLGWNCSAVAAEALKQGGGEAGFWDLLTSVNIVWSPQDVADFARAIQKEKSKQKKNPCP